MEWLNDLLRREGLLRRRIAQIMEDRPAAPAGPASGAPAGVRARERFRRCVEPQVRAIDALLEDYLCGRTEDERSRMRFEARLRLPVYSHLRNLFTIAPPGCR